MNEKGTIRRGNGRRGRRRRRARMPKGPRAGGSSTSSAIVGVCVIALALDSKATTQCPPALPASPVQILFAAAATAPASQPHSQPSCSAHWKEQHRGNSEEFGTSNSHFEISDELNRLVSQLESSHEAYQTLSCS
ncbi:uncharacterized protein [Physcomitrium patens]|uniref:uncharacterized protein n=1 Tax=Physcomitrium patens TaxID=3218 RepID=UPI003CCE0C10